MFNDYYQSITNQDVFGNSLTRRVTLSFNVTSFVITPSEADGYALGAEIFYILTNKGWNVTSIDARPRNGFYEVEIDVLLSNVFTGDEAVSALRDDLRGRIGVVDNIVYTDTREVSTNTNTPVNNTNPNTTNTNSPTNTLPPKKSTNFLEEIGKVFGFDKSDGTLGKLGLGAAGGGLAVLLLVLLLSKK